VRVDDDAPADGDAGRRLADNEAIARSHRHGLFQPQLRPTFAAGHDLLGIQQTDARGRLGRAAEEIDRLIMA